MKYLELDLYNNFHNRSTLVRLIPIKEGKNTGLAHISYRKARGLKRLLCGANGCKCSGNFGETSGNFELINTTDTGYLVNIIP